MTNSPTHGPEVDVVVPCYNYGRFLRDCVSSVLSQTGVRVRVLIIDDCSTDDTKDVSDDLVRSDSRVSYRRHDINRGHIATYNEGLLEWAEAPYSVLISADDMLSPGSLARATTVLESHAAVAMAYGMALVVTERPPVDVQQSVQSDAVRIIHGDEFLDKCFSETYCLVSTPTVVVRTEVQKRLGGYRQDLPHSGDVEMWMRFGLAGNIAVLGAIQGYYRWHGKNMGQKYYVQRIGDQEEFAEACRIALEGYTQRHPRANDWWARISQKLGNEAFWASSKAFDRLSIEECAAWAKFAVEIHPRIRYSTIWWRFAAKRVLGVRVWRTIRPILERVRGTQDCYWESDEGVPFSAGRLVGWWPAESGRAAQTKLA